MLVIHTVFGDKNSISFLLRLDSPLQMERPTILRFYHGEFRNLVPPVSRRPFSVDYSVDIIT